ncbi:hypothetical protein A2125_00930 [Candidatus Woesebacteria bacterium GWB1_43_5]|uniref:Uncharacterized protein n=1 Tax=Candidatus Woesebacteria bacterium GWB1_43_5 TaxID=1802474 RepID=A0A1F7WTQ3_9BACT|nr:MAG: hypothetical protein A2125_00930 [Candidatus Woesebacteria bacterium GWB1_43_5]
MVRAQGPDESMTARGLLGRFYIDAATNPAATLRTGIGVESSARASYNGGPEVAAEAGTAFVGSRIWMAPYFSAATVNNLNNFWGLWIYGEHATQRNGDAAIKISDAGGGFTDDLILQEGTKIRNDVAGDLIVQGNGAANDEDLKFDFETTANEVGVSSSTGVTEIDFGTINLATTGTIGTGNITMSSTAPTLTSKDTDATAGDANSSISTNCTDIGNGTEDCDVILTQQVAGANVDFMSADADGALYLNATGGIILQDDGGTSLAITNDATKTSLVPTAGDYLRIGDVASTTHALDTNDDLLVTGRLEIDGITFANAKVDLIDNIDLNLGTGEDVIFRFSTTQTPDTGLVGLGVEANSLVFVERADMSTDFAHALQTNPTLFIQSADALTPADYISITHDQTNGQIGSGTGALVLDASNGIVLNDSGTQALGVSSDGTLATILPAVGDYLRIGDANTTSQGFATNDDLVVTGGLEVNGATYIDGTQYVTTSGTVYYDQRPIYMGSSLDTTIVHSTVQTPDGLIWGVGAENNGLIISENADISYDFAHALQTNPTLWIQSATQSATQWMSLAHDQTDGRIITGAGNLSIGTGSDGHTLNTPNDLFVSGKVEADGAIFADAGITVNGGNIVLGNDWAWSGVTDVGNFFANLTSQTVDSMVFSVATGNRYIMMIEQGDQAVNFGHTAQTNPTLFIQSADATSVTDYMGLTHDQTNAVITAGNGAIIKDSVTATITASTTQTQGNGPLTTNINEVSVVANANDTVTLPAAAAGLCVKIANNGANVLQIFPASGDDLGAGVNTSDTLIATTNVEFCAYDNINWEIF